MVATVDKTMNSSSNVSVCSLMVFLPRVLFAFLYKSARDRSPDTIHRGSTNTGKLHNLVVKRIIGKGNYKNITLEKYKFPPETSGR